MEVSWIGNFLVFEFAKLWVEGAQTKARDTSTFPASLRRQEPLNWKEPSIILYSNCLFIVKTLVSWTYALILCNGGCPH